MEYHLENMSAVLSREADNRHHIYLYPRCRGKAWVSYEQSAHNLHLLMPHIKPISRKVEGVPQPITSFVVPKLSLEFLIEKGVDVRACDNGRNLKLTLPREMRKSKRKEGGAGEKRGDYPLGGK